MYTPHNCPSGRHRVGHFPFDLCQPLLEGTVLPCTQVMSKPDPTSSYSVGESLQSEAEREAGAWDGIWPLWLQVNSERCNGVKAATMCGSARWLPSNVIPPDNRHKCLSSGPPDSAGRGIFLQGSVGSMVCNHTAWFFSVIHVFSETSEELKGIRPMELKKWGIRDKPHPKPSLVPYLFWIPQCLGLLSFLLCNTRGIEYNL